MALNPSVQNNFTGGLKTEFTGLNFPENACTQTENCVFTIIGDVLRREGFDYEANAVLNLNIDRTNVAINTYKWNNVGGDGNTQIIVLQVGVTLFFFQSTNATILNPLSSTKLTSFVNLSSFVSPGTVFNSTIECQFTDGNGYLFVFHTNIDSIFCIFNAGVITAKAITIQIRDFAGIPEPGIADNFRPTTLTAEHKYNLINQGWTQGSAWTGTGNANNFGLTLPCIGNSWTMTISSQTNTTTLTNGSVIKVNIPGAAIVGANNNNQNLSATVTGVVNNYVTPFNTVTIIVGTISYDCSRTAFGFWSGGNFFQTSNEAISMSLINVGFINSWFSAIGNYPSNSDVWWLYKDSTNLFNPTTTIANVQQPIGPAPKGSFIINAFIQDRSAVSSISGLTTVTTPLRPTVGTWFQGRLFYAGVNASQQPTGDEPYYTWTENIYFSQVVTDTSKFGKAYQVNDPTAQNLFDILPTDGGVITIQGAGSIYELFPIQTGIIVRAANGVYYISGGSGVAFSASDYSVSKISNIQSISPTRSVNVQGWPMFWNEEGIYYVTVRQNSSSIRSPDINLDVQNLCLGTILSFYASIPLQSKKFARGDYHPLDYIVQFCYRSTNESNVTDRYQFDSIINFNIATKAFYLYQISTATNSPYIHGINYVAGPGGSSSPNPVFKYITSQQIPNTYNFTFSEERDPTFIDWVTSGVSLDYVSNFVTGYKLSGKAVTKFQPQYVYIYSNNSANTSYQIQGIWDYAINRNSNKFGVPQIINNFLNTTNFSRLFRRHRIRGRGLVLQFQISSVTKKPFDIMGWSILENVQEHM